MIDAATQVFWRHGYAGASINQLTAATGLSRSSLYQRFQDKDGLFKEALANYGRRVVRRMSAAQADTRRGQLEAMLRSFVAPDGSTDRPSGCLLARSCAEMADLPPTGQSQALAGLQGQRAMIAEILRAAVEGGELGPGADVDALAWHFLGVAQAIPNLPQAGATAGEVQRMVDLALRAWPSASASAPAQPAAKRARPGAK